MPRSREMADTMHMIHRDLERFLGVVDPADAPTIENEPSLQEWLEAHRAEMVWRVTSPTTKGKKFPDFAVSLWKFPNGKAAIIQVASHGRGWEIYPALGASDIDDSLTAAEEALGLPFVR